MNHFAPALLLFTLASSPHSQPAPLPDAPSARLEPQPQSQQPSSTSASTPSTPSPQPVPDSPWLKVEQLPPGQHIAVLTHGGRYPTSCTMDLANDTTLACIEATPYYLPPRRAVYPIAIIEAVYTEKLEYGPSAKEMLIGAGVGAAIGGALCHSSSAGFIAMCAGLGATFWILVVTSPDPLPSPPRISRQLIYSAP